MTQSLEPGWRSPFPGGRRAAEARLAAIDPARYGSTRNHLDGAVTRLSPYIRHGVLTLAEVREVVFSRLERGAGGTAGAVLQPDLFIAAADSGTAGPGAAAGGRRIWSAAQRRAGEKLINELGWRDYWQRLWMQLGDGIWHDREPLKTGHPAEAYAAGLPADIAAASTGLPCIDGFATELLETGWLHNHARMWFASYVVHWRRVRWQAGARWFLQHLLDGDPASNNLSWQWVASSFSHKPYIFNRANLERFSSGRFCATCPRAGRGGAAGCPFEASYEALQERLFRPLDPRTQSAGPPQEHGSPEGGQGGGSQSPRPGGSEAEGPLLWSAPASDRRVPDGAAAPLHRPLVWVHEEALGPANPALRAHPEAPALAVLDADWLAGHRTAAAPPLSPEPSAGRRTREEPGELPPAPGRIRFLRECLAELPVAVRQGDGAAEVLAAARAFGCDGVVSTLPVDPRLRRLAARVAAELPLRLLAPAPFVDLPVAGPGAPDLRRFSRYWRRAEPLVWAQE
jgi:deoxyribodipyrimidine photo-lyase